MREFRAVVQEALWEAMPSDVRITSALVESVTRALKKHLMERFDAGVPVYLVGSKEIMFKKSRDDRHAYAKIRRERKVK